MFKEIYHVAAHQLNSIKTSYIYGMKKLISLTLFLFLGLIAKSQTADETLDWLRAKQPEVRSFTTTSIKYPPNEDAKLVIDEESIIAANSKVSTKILLINVKDVSSHLGNVIIVGNELVEGKNTFIRLSLSSAIYDKYAKALKHYATLKGAKLVKEDLF